MIRYSSSGCQWYTQLSSSAFEPCVLLQLTISCSGRRREGKHYSKEKKFIRFNWKRSWKNYINIANWNKCQKWLKISWQTTLKLIYQSILTPKMSLNDIKIPKSTLAELRGVLVRALSRENLSVSDKMAIRKSQSSSSLKIHYTWNSNYGGKKRRRFFFRMFLWWWKGNVTTHFVGLMISVYSDVIVVKRNILSSGLSIFSYTQEQVACFVFNHRSIEMW
jgi:hypothetical protein